MTDSLDRWHSRDLPFLTFMAPLIDAEPFMGATLQQAMDGLEWTIEQCLAATKALEDGGLVEVRWAMSGGYTTRVTALSAGARSAVGMWPNDEVAADRLLQSVAALATDEHLDAAERGRWVTIRDTLGQMTREVVVRVATGVLTGEIPH